MFSQFLGKLFLVGLLTFGFYFSVLIGYCDCHLVTKIGYYDYLANSRFQMPFLYCKSITL